MKALLYCALLLAPLSGKAQAYEIVCNVNRSESYVIRPDSQTVDHEVFLQKSSKLELTAFNVYRCPGCFGFEGTADGNTYLGQTRGTFGTNGLEYTLKLTINGEEQEEIFCFVPEN